MKILEERTFSTAGTLKMVRELDFSELELRIASQIEQKKKKNWNGNRLILITIDDKKQVNSAKVQEAVTFVSRFLRDVGVGHKDVFSTSLYDEFGRVLSLFLMREHTALALKKEIGLRPRTLLTVNMFDLTPNWYRLWRDNGSRIWPLFELQKQVVKPSRLGLTSGVARLNSRTRLEYGDQPHSEGVLLPKVVVNCTLGSYIDMNVIGSTND